MSQAFTDVIYIDININIYVDIDILSITQFYIFYNTIICIKLLQFQILFHVVHDLKL